MSWSAENPSRYTDYQGLLPTRYRMRSRSDARKPYRQAPSETAPCVFSWDLSFPVPSSGRLRSTIAANPSEQLPRYWTDRPRTACNKSPVRRAAVRKATPAKPFFVHPFDDFAKSPARSMIRSVACPSQLCINFSRKAESLLALSSRMPCSLQESSETSPSVSSFVSR